MKHADFVAWIPLGPYSSNEEVLVISGYPTKDVIEEIKMHFKSHSKLDSIHRIRDTMKSMNDYLGFCKEFEKAIDDCYKNTGPSRAFFFTHSVDGIHSYIIVLMENLDRDDYRDVAVVSHEVLHLCQSFLPRFLDRNAEHEAEAYFHMRITEQILELGS